MNKAIKNRMTNLVGGKCVLRNKFNNENAIDKLFEYENTGLLPEQIAALQETIYNLQQRIKKLEEWN